MLAEEILQACHPNAIRFVKYYLTITHTRWEQALSRSQQRAVKLQETLRVVRTNAALVDELMVYLTDCHALLSTKEKDSIPDDLTVVEELVKEHAEFQEDLSSRSQEIEKLIRSLPSVTAAAKPRSTLRPYGNGGAGGTATRPSDVHEVPSAGAAALQKKWQTICRMSAERHKKLQEVHNRLLEIESLKNFDFDVWRQRYITWTRTNKLKYVDFFRRLDKEGTGVVTRKDFIDGILASKFPTSAAELGAVFSLFDTHKYGRIYYKSFLDAIMRPDKEFLPQKGGTRQMSEADQIHAEVEDQLAQCQCHSQFAMVRIDDGKYKFGDKEKIWQLRLLNGRVFVRFGASVMPLEEFLASNDPCREKPGTRGIGRQGMNSRLSGSASNLALLSKASPSSSRTSMLGGTGLAGQRNGYMAKSWSNLSTAISSPLSPRGTVFPARSPSTASSKPSLTLSIPSPRTPQQRRFQPASSSSTSSSSAAAADSPRSFPPPLSSRSTVMTPSTFAASLRSATTTTPTPTSTPRQPPQSSATTPVRDVTGSRTATPTTTMAGTAGTIGGSSSAVGRSGSRDAAVRTRVSSLTTAAAAINGSGAPQEPQQPRKSLSSASAVRNSSPAPSKHSSQLRSAFLYSPAQDIDF